MRILLLAGALVIALVAAAPAGAAVKRLEADMTGTQEVSGGDADGTGTAKLRLNRATRRVCFTIRVRRIDEVVAAHIHRGARGVDGGIEVDLLESPGAGRRFSGCTEDVSRRLIRQIVRRPRRFYVNVHTFAHAGGAVRGQLHRPAT